MDCASVAVRRPDGQLLFAVSSAADAATACLMMPRPDGNLMVVGRVFE